MQAIPKMPDVEMSVEVREHIQKLETALVNMMTDNGEYKSEYERIAEEGKLLYTTYASKSNQLKQLAALNVKLQGETSSAKERENAAVKEVEKEKQEAEKWKQKYKEQLDKHKDLFSALDKMKQVKDKKKKKRKFVFFVDKKKNF
jgi:hypothetical protein